MMKLKNRLSLYAVTIFGIIILIASTIIYISFYSRMENQEFEHLESKSLLSALFYLEKDEISFSEHQSIKSQFQKSISRKNILILDSLNQRFDGMMEDDHNLKPSFVDQVRAGNTVKLKTTDYFYQGLFYKDNQGDFVILIREPTLVFQQQMDMLFHILIAVSIIGLVLILIFSQYLGFIAYDPIMKMMNEIKKRDNQNFNQPIIIQNSYQEVHKLVDTYNKFVSQLSQTFFIQKNFIDYVSHELRTPIAAILGTIEVNKQKQRTLEEYAEVNLIVQKYTEDLNDTIEQMMILSGAKTSFELKETRIDEVIWNITEKLNADPYTQIAVDIQVGESFNLKFPANEKLLELALSNLIQNAVKYSDYKLVRILLRSNGSQLVIEIIDQGIGILTDELDKVTANFYRGKNAQAYAGKGIGLSLANTIFEIHNIQMKIQSNNTGTSVSLYF